MIERLYVDNYLCLVNFEWRPGSFTLLLGRNGSGKSAMFEAMVGLRSVLTGEKLDEVFDDSTVTAWNHRPLRVFELDVRLEANHFRYRLEVINNGAGPRIRYESLAINGSDAVVLKDGQAHVIRRGVEASLLASDVLSAVFLAPPVDGIDPRIHAFKEYMLEIGVLGPEPTSISDESDEPEPILDGNLENFASWYRFILLEHGEERAEGLNRRLREVLDGFNCLKFIHLSGERWQLTAEFRPPATAANREPYRIPLSDLSDGQRGLIGLYAILEFLVTEARTLCLDEPENYLALAEVQPWITELRDRAAEAGTQVLVISHHPDIINYMAADSAVLFERGPDGATRVRPFEVDDDNVMQASEIIARGWENG